MIVRHFASCGAISSAEFTRKQPLRCRSLIEWSTISAKKRLDRLLSAEAPPRALQPAARCVLEVVLKRSPE